MTEPVRRLVDEPGLQRLWSRVHARLEESGGVLEGSVNLRALTVDERLAVGMLLGVRPRGESMRVRLTDVDAAAQRAGATLADVVASAVGPIRDRPGERRSRAAAADKRRAAVLSHPAVGRHPGIAGWAESVRVRTENWPSLVTALDVLAELPSPEPVSRGRLAAIVAGDSHALDDNRVVATLVLGGLSAIADQDPPRTAAERRDLWRTFGVMVDDTSSTVLALRLHPEPVGPITTAAADWLGTGLVVPLTLRMVQQETWRVAPGTVIWVCENPSVIEAAAGAATSATVVCIAGNPSLAARRLLQSLSAGGARLRYHGDFGSGGLAIGNVVIGELGAEPWRFATDDYLHALADLDPARLPRLRGPVPDAQWDARLAEAVRAGGVEVQEEHVLDELLADLR